MATAVAILSVGGVLGFGTLVAAPPAAASGGVCANSPSETWVGGSGAWETASNWSPATVPTATSTVCLPAAGSPYTVTISQGGQAGQLEVGDNALLKVEGNGPQGNAVDLTLDPGASPAGTVDSGGEIELTAISTNSTPNLAVNDGSTFTIEAGGELLSDPTDYTPNMNGYGVRQLIGDLTNDGIVQINADTSFFNGGTFTNDGTLNTAASTTLSTSSNGTAFVNGPTGSISNDGTISCAGGGGETEAGTTSGNPIDFSDTLTFTGTGASSFLGDSFAHIAGNMAAGQSVIVQADSGNPFYADVGYTGPATMAGNLTVQIAPGSPSPGAGAALSIGSGSLTVTGNLTFGDANGGGLQLIGGQNVINDGTVNVNDNTSFFQGATFTNQGAFTVATGTTFNTNGNGTGFVNGSGGAITNDGEFASTGGGGFDEGAGTTGGNPIDMSGNNLDITGDGASSFEWTNNGGNLTGNIAAGQSIALNAATNTVFVNTSASFTNAGTLTLTNGGADAAELGLGGHTLTNTGSIVDDPMGTAGDGLLFGGTVDNQGSLTVDAAPGSPKTFGIPNYIQTATGSFHTEITGDTLWGQLGVNGSATLAGTLAIDTTSPPDPGTAFPIVAGANTVSGTFTTQQYIGTTQYTITYPPGGVTATVLQSTTTGLSSLVNPSLVGQQVTYTATVSPAPGDGTVAFTDGGRTRILGCGAQPVNGSGVATCAVTYSTAGSYSIGATYAGGTTDASSSSPVLTQDVGNPPTTTASNLRPTPHWWVTRSPIRPP